MAHARISSLPTPNDATPGVALPFPRLSRGFARLSKVPPTPSRLPIAQPASVAPTATPSASAPTTASKPNPRKPRVGCKIQNNELRPHVLSEDCLRAWKSPFGQDRDVAFHQDLPSVVVEKSYTALFASFAGATQSNYAAGLLWFHQFCDLHLISEHTRMPASHFLLAAFITNRVGTVKSWMSGIKAWHDLNSMPWEGDNCWVELARHTNNKEGAAFKRAQQGPVTLEHMLALRAALDL
ncbi:hypothetical protein B0H10DRAFT_2443906 [Mycena sp. CBHHK59/15]|nr:hypothetical protein B0H10DRAFT_2443906 [Mycena sp. CBHHK59/15]